MKTKLFLLATVGIMLTACSNDDEVMNNGSVAAVINADISAAITTRAIGTVWDEGDRIGISENRFGYTNVSYKRESGKFEPAGTVIYFRDATPTTFSAYYPYNENGGTLTATIDAAAQRTPSAIDFLFATGATADTHSPEVSFTDNTATGGADCSFHHCMSQVTLTFEPGSGVDFTTIKPSGYTLSGLVLKGSFDTTDGTAKADEGAQKPDLALTLTGGVLSSSVILFPQTTASIGLAVMFDGNQYNTTLAVPDGALKPGNNYTCTVTVRNKELIISNAEITPWNPVNGGNVNADL